MSKLAGETDGKTGQCLEGSYKYDSAKEPRLEIFLKYT